MKKFIVVFVVAVSVLVAFAATVLAGPLDGLVKRDGSDVLVHNVIIAQIPPTPGTPVYAATNLNGWLVRGPKYTSAEKLAATQMIQEGQYWRAKNMFGQRFHPAQVGNLANTNPDNVRWARVENLEGIDFDNPPDWLDLSKGKNQPCIKK